MFFRLVRNCGEAMVRRLSHVGQTEAAGGRRRAKRSPRLLSALAGGLVLGSAAVSAAQSSGTSLDPVALDGKRISVDGRLREWSGFVRFSQTLSGSADSEPQVSAALAYDAQQLYLAFSIKDDEQVRTPSFGAAEDHLTLTLAVPKASGGYETYSVQIYPGVPGKSAGAVKLGKQTLPGAKVVEAPAQGGLDVEVSIPWQALSATRAIRVGLKGSLKYTDYDKGGLKAVVGTSSAQSPAGMPNFRFENEQGLDANLLRPENLSSTPSFAAYANLAGDAALEQVALYGKYLTILGGGYREGKQFFYKDLGVSSASMVPKIQLADLTGDGRAEILVQKRVGAPGQYREYLEVLSVSAKGEPFVVFQHELAVVTEDGKIENKLQLGKHAGKPALIIAQGLAEGWDEGSYDQSRQQAMGSVLLPWETIGERSFAWDGKAFSQVAEKQVKPRLNTGGAKKPNASGKTTEQPAAPPAPRPPTADELLDQVYALYRKERKVGEAKPRFDFVTDVAGDGSTERVLVHGLDVVVFGKGYRGGTGFAFITLPAKAPEDILHVTARDITGDGKAEVLVRALLKTKTSEELGGVVVERQVLFVYQVTDQSIVRVFSAETGRRLGDKRVIGSLLFKPLEQGVELQIKAGRLVGWDKNTYPFPVETQASGGLEPLLLPWSNPSELRYRFIGAAFQRQ